jgi:Leucine-rich repeat (LRR) protein
MDLNLTNSDLSTLPELPEDLVELNCFNNRLTSLPVLPKGLMKLDCFNNELTSLPELPKNLFLLNCNSNQIITLPELPETLEDLICDNNKLISLPEIPEGVHELSCTNNQLTSLPELPEGLSELYCSDNQLTSLPELPEGLSELWCYRNKLKILPKLPENLRELKCKHNPFIEPYKTFVEEFYHDNNIDKIRQKINDYYKIQREKGRNMSSLMQTVGAYELIASKKWPNRNMANFQKRIPANALSVIGYYLSGVKDKRYADQQKILQESFIQKSDFGKRSKVINQKENDFVIKDPVKKAIKSKNQIGGKTRKNRFIKMSRYSRKTRR